VPDPTRVAGAGGPRHVVLVGLMGSGKTTVGKKVAKLTGHRFVDADVELEARTGRSVADWFATEGEAGFRRAEAELLASLLDEPEPLVIGAGGGVVIAPGNRALLAGGRALVVYLHGEPAFLASRAQAKPHRPLLAGADPHELFARLHAERDPWYREVADAVVEIRPHHEAGEKPKWRIAETVVDALAGLDRVGGPADDVTPEQRSAPVIELDVPLGDRTYPVLVGPGARHRLLEVLPVGVRRVAIVTQASIPVTVDPGVDHRVFTIGEGEDHKDLGTVEDLCRDWAQWGLTRGDCVVAVGGGVVTDTAGFAAAVYHRGVPVVHVATTLLGQVDAAIGGKTGVNLPEGKNLVGAFWQPAAVICDTEVLVTLAPREYRNGQGEMAKYAFLGVERLPDLPLEEAVAACVRLKAEVVAADEREGGRRAVLNYGHTLAHALEIAGRYDLRHGEAVAIGIVYAAELARLLGRIDGARVAEHRRVVAAYDLPVAVPEGIDADEVLTLFGRDKKAVRGITFVLDGPDGVEPVAVDDERVLREALDRVRA